MWKECIIYIQNIDCTRLSLWKKDVSRPNMQESNVRRECVLLTDTVLNICKAKSVKQITLI